MSLTNLKFVVILCVVCCSIWALSQSDAQMTAREELNTGVRAYKNANYEEAIARFQKAVKLDPEFVIAHLYLATAYAQQYVPGVETSENLKMADSALDQYSEVLQRQPKNEIAIKGKAYIYMQMKKFDEARLYYKMAVAVNSNDPENFYSLGVIDWSIAYSKAADEHARVGLKVEDAIKNREICSGLRTEILPIIEEGMDTLNKAISLRLDYDDAMVYLNLLYRRRADVQCGDMIARKKDLEQANVWADRAMATRKKKADEAAKKNQTPADTPPR